MSTEKRAIAAVAFLAAIAPAQASQPCMGHWPQLAFVGARPHVLRLPADARLLCGLGKEPVLREAAGAGGIPVEVKYSCREGHCECTLPDGVATSAARTYLLRDAAGTPLARFEGSSGQGRGVRCRPRPPAPGPVTVEELRPRGTVALTPWPGAPPYTCYALPPRGKLVPGRRYVWREAAEASFLSFQPEFVEIVAAGAPAAAPPAPALVPREAALKGACPPHGALEFVPAGTPRPGEAPPPDAGGVALLHRWEVRAIGGARLVGPSLGAMPHVVAYAEPSESPGGALRLGQPYELVVTAIDAWGRESPPATLRFEITRTGGVP